MLLLLFWPTLIGLPGTWNASYQEHGFFVGGLVVWLVWRDRRRFVDEAGTPIPDLIPLLGLVSLVWMAAAIMNIRMIQQAVLGAVLVGWALAVFGWEQRRRILMLGATFMLAVPFWGSLAPILQRATTIASGGATSLAGISAEIGYNHISISTGTFLIEEGCAGINYLMGGLVLGAFYAHLFVERWQTQLKIVALAGVMSIVGNWIRVTVLIFLGEATAMQSPYIEDHLWQGWLIFTLMMIPAYWMARAIERRDAKRHEKGPEDVLVYQPPPHEPSPLAEEPYDAQRPRRAAWAALAVGLGPILFMTIGAIPRGADLDRTTDALGIVEGWDVADADEAALAWLPDFKGADARAAWSVRGDGVELEAGRHYFTDQRQGAELIQYNNFIAADSLVASDRLLGPVGPRGRFVREALVRDDPHGRVVWYWYRVAGFDTPFPSKAKLLELLGFLRRSPASELITLTAPCDAESCLVAARALRAATGGPRIPDPPAESGPEPSGDSTASSGDGAPGDSTGGQGAGGRSTR